ncbi:MAG TPA: VanZ family protein [Bacillales bacterium]|nr:VanZ family protein [Bacillales bacterium]
MNKFISWFLVILWMILIFFLSNQPATQSGALSTGIAAVIIQAIEKLSGHIGFDLAQFDHIVRKNAHFFVYLVLGVLVYNALKRSGRNRNILLAFMICVLYAISDEIHQMFVPGRGPGIKDVLIDSTGAIVGIGMYWVIGRKRQRIKSSEQ